MDGLAQALLGHRALQGSAQLSRAVATRQSLERLFLVLSRFHVYLFIEFVNKSTVFKLQLRYDTLLVRYFVLQALCKRPPLHGVPVYYA